MTHHMTQLLLVLQLPLVFEDGCERPMVPPRPGQNYSAGRVHCRCQRELSLLWSLHADQAVASARAADHCLRAHALSKEEASISSKGVPRVESTTLPGACANYSRPQSRWLLDGRPPLAEPIIVSPVEYSAADVPWLRSRARVLFVPIRAFVEMGYSSVTYRCIDVPKMLGRSFQHCEDPSLPLLAGRFDVFLHCKSVCKWMLEHPSTRDKLHILDGVDAYQLAPPSFRGQIFGNTADLEAHCNTLVCAVVPHHNNLRPKLLANECTLDPGTQRSRPPGRRARPIGIIGTQCDTKLQMDLEKVWMERVRREPYYNATSQGLQRACHFYSSVDAVVAWKQFKWHGQSPSHAPNILWKPPTRYTNTVLLGVPTIAYAGYRAYQELAPPELLCYSEECVHDTIMLLRAGKLDVQVRQQQRCVTAMFSNHEIASRYEQVFDATMNRQHAATRRNGDTKRRHGYP